MASQPPSASPLFLREAEIRRGIELLFFGHGELMASADALLEEKGLGRAHHRALYFIARKPGLPVGDLIALLGITKQSLGRVLRELEQRELVERKPGREDRRQVLLKLTASGTALEAKLFEALREKMVAAYSDAGSAAISGFWTVLEKLLSADRAALAGELGDKR
ncbi:MarR family winged helix-turn-helix transcriptional regulator [uncultured Parasphingopyxis sp.]|uniref:MarR family winged helix-turn-helix transcriptional regulator n=1 Tax=uncultured Parasphingopyxis sp. TaxID=1547918 RepID=UPI002626CC3B|nr:MarR family transcriptional regulator [uncultured Parasphingopyxis sp.]